MRRGFKFTWGVGRPMFMLLLTHSTCQSVPCCVRLMSGIGRTLSCVLETRFSYPWAFLHAPCVLFGSIWKLRDDIWKTNPNFAVPYFGPRHHHPRASCHHQRVGMLVVALLCLLPCALAAPTFTGRGGHAIQNSDDNNVHINSHMTRAERDEAIRKLQSAYNASTIGDLRTDCNNCINAQQASIDAHAVCASASCHATLERTLERAP